MSDEGDLVLIQPLEAITPLKAQALLGEGARLVDIRSEQEFARARIPGAENQPLGTIEPFADGLSVVFHCRTGLRSEANAAELAALCQAGAYRIEGGIEAWRNAGLPMLSEGDGAKRLDGMGLAIAGGAILVALLFGWVRSAWWLLVPAVIAGDMIRSGLGGDSILARGFELVRGRLAKMRQEP